MTPAKSLAPRKAKPQRAAHLERREGTYERIIAAASNLFIRHGYQGTPMSLVAKSSGVTTAALYWHFQSKEELYFIVVKRGYTEFFEELSARTVGRTAKERLVSYVRAFVDMQLRDPEVSMQYGYGQLRAALSPEKQSEIESIESLYRDSFKQILVDGLAEGAFSCENLSLTALAVITMCEYAFTWFRPDGALSPAEVADIYAELACSIVSAAPSPQAA